MDRYQRVEKPRPEIPISENEIRITSQGLIRNYISYATTLLQEKQVKEIVFKAMGQAISKTVAIAEIVKKRIPNLHQDTAISSVSITDVWEPIEDGLLSVETTRHISMISITLSPQELDKNSPGYQAPYPIEQEKLQSYQQQQPRQIRLAYKATNEDSHVRGQGRGRGRGRGWGGRRGGYGNYQDNGGYSNYSQGGYGNYQDNNGGYLNWGQNRGRGRGWGNSGNNGDGYDEGYERGRGRIPGPRYERGRGGMRGGGRYGTFNNGGNEGAEYYEGGNGGMSETRYERGGYRGGRGRGYGGRGRTGGRTRGGGGGNQA